MDCGKSEVKWKYLPVPDPVVVFVKGAEMDIQNP
jgi:hypothetical protein